MIFITKKFDVNENGIDTIEIRRDLENLSTLKKYFRAGNELLESGIGKGFLSSAENEGFKVTGVELNKENCMKAKDILSTIQYKWYIQLILKVIFTIVYI